MTDDGENFAQSKWPRHVKSVMITLVAGAFSVLAATPSAKAQRIDNPVAVFAALDKVTARISKLRVELDGTMRFGALKVTPRACYTRPPTEPPHTTAFVQVDEIQSDESEKRIFSGWMFAEDPGLNSLEHPVFDIWLTGCSLTTQEVAQNRPLREPTRLSERMPIPIRKPYRRLPQSRRRTLR